MTVARMPEAEWLPADDTNSHLAMARWDIVCVHTIVGTAPAKAAHFSIRGDGHIYQHRDTSVQSAANYAGNPRCIAIENADMGVGYAAWDRNDGHAVPFFSTSHAEALANVIAWCNRTLGIPLQPAPNSKPDSRGVAYHRQGIDGNWGSYAYGGRVVGGEHWSTSTGKVCPGDRRISQLLSLIIPRARVLAGLDHAQEVSDMTPEEHNAIWEIRARLRSIHTKGFEEVGLEEARSMAGDLSWFQGQLAGSVIADGVEELLGRTGVDARQVAAELLAQGYGAGATVEQVASIVTGIRLTTQEGP